jgi:pimeloyl-ACP methyl ester carboxylesterase
VKYALRVFVVTPARALLACASPIGVEPANPKQVHRALTKNALSTGELSVETRNLLRRANLLDLYEADPEVALVSAHELLKDSAPQAERAIVVAALVGLAEASFLHAERSGDQRFFLAAALYAWAYMFSALGEVQPFDARLPLASNLYNRSLTLALLAKHDPDRTGIVVTGGRYELPWGELTIAFDESELQWGARRFVDFASVSDVHVRGMRNRYRSAGLGIAVAASTDSPSREDTEDLLLDDTRVPASVVVVFDDLRRDFESGEFRARLEIHSSESGVFDVDGQHIPLEFDRTASLALMLTETAPWQQELSGFFQGDLAVEEGLKSLGAHQPGRIPVVLVHGTASSVATWANFLNDLLAVDEVRERYEFFFFTYNTGAPIAYSAWRLRNAIDEMLETLDPEGSDAALRRAIVIGHSQGGLLTKMLTVSSGDRFWHMVSDEPFEDLDLPADSRELISGSLFVTPHPAVERVVFIATPHRGSYLAAFGIAKWVGSLVRAPANVVRSFADLVTLNEEATAIRRVDDVTGSVANMSPGSEFLQELVAMPIAPAIQGHSIIATRELTGTKEDWSDGVVEYESAQLSDVESEVVVESGHSCLSHPHVITEAQRILLMHARQP